MLNKLIEKMCNGEEDILICLVTSNISNVLTELEEIAVEICSKKQLITLSNNVRIKVLSDNYPFLCRGRVNTWLHGSQPNGVVFYDTKQATIDDKLYAMSRVRRPKGLFEKYTLVSADSGCDFVSFISTGIFRVEKE